MTRGRARIHLDASRAGDPLRRARCGWLDVDTETDATKVTCKSCLARVAASRLEAAPRGRAATADLTKEIKAAFQATLAPTASISPRITPALWASSCKTAVRRCGECELCQWEREAQLWAAVSPWTKHHALILPEGAPRWSSLTAALAAFVEFERHDRSSPSALGGILDRVRRGATGEATSARPDDPLLRRAGELVRVRQALELAYPDGAHSIPAEKCRALLLLRTPGIVAQVMPGYEELGQLFGAATGELQALVRNGRKVVGDELARRGLIPIPRPALRGGLRTSAAHYAEAIG